MEIRVLSDCQPSISAAAFIWLADGAMMSGMRFAGEGGKHDVCCPRCRW